MRALGLDREGKKWTPGGPCLEGPTRVQITVIRDLPQKRNKKVYILAMDPFHGCEDEVTVNGLEAPESLDSDMLTWSLLGVGILHYFPAAGSWLDY